MTAHVASSTVATARGSGVAVPPQREADRGRGEDGRRRARTRPSAPPGGAARRPRGAACGRRRRAGRRPRPGSTGRRSCRPRPAGSPRRSPANRPPTPPVAGRRPDVERPVGRAGRRASWSMLHTGWDGVGRAEADRVHADVPSPRPRSAATSGSTPRVFAPSVSTTIVSGWKSPTGGAGVAGVAGRGRGRSSTGRPSRARRRSVRPRCCARRWRRSRPGWPCRSPSRATSSACRWRRSACAGRWSAGRRAPAKPANATRPIWVPSCWLRMNAPRRVLGDDEAVRGDVGRAHRAGDVDRQQDRRGAAGERHLGRRPGRADAEHERGWRRAGRAGSAASSGRGPGSRRGSPPRSTPAPRACAAGAARARARRAAAARRPARRAPTAR